MADSSATGAPALSTNIASGKFDDEKAPHTTLPTKQKVEEEEEEDEDIDALIEDLESQDGHVVSNPISPRLPQLHSFPDHVRDRVLPLKPPGGAISLTNCFPHVCLFGGPIFASLIAPVLALRGTDTN